MKKIEAIIRKTKFEDVKEALFEADINWFSYSEVHAIGQDRQDRIYRGVMYSTDIISRIEITIICRDQFVEPAICHDHTEGDSRSNYFLPKQDLNP